MVRFVHRLARAVWSEWADIGREMEATAMDQILQIGVMTFSKG